MEVLQVLVLLAAEERTEDLAGHLLGRQEAYDEVRNSKYAGQADRQSFIPVQSLSEEVCGKYNVDERLRRSNHNSEDQWQHHQQRLSNGSEVLPVVVAALFFQVTYEVRVRKNCCRDDRFGFVVLIANYCMVHFLDASLVARS